MNFFVEEIHWAVDGDAECLNFSGRAVSDYVAVGWMVDLDSDACVLISR